MASSVEPPIFPDTSSPDFSTPPVSPAPTIPPAPILEAAQKESPPNPGQPLEPAPPVTQVVAQPKPKSGFFKKLLALILGLGFILVIILVGLKFLPSVRQSLPFTGKVELTWWGLWEDNAIVMPLIEEYQKDHPKVKINYLAQSKEDYRERLINSLAQGKGPDIFRIHNTWVPMFKNALAPLPADVFSSQEFESTFYSVTVKDLSTPSGLVGIPLMYDGLGLYINEEIFATYGKTVPRTWDELLETALALTIKDQNGVIKQSGVALGRADNVDHWPEILALMLIQNGADLNDLTRNRTLTEGALSFYTSFSNPLDIWDETLPPSTAYFATGKLAMYFAPSWRAIEIIDQNPSLRFKVVSVPQLPKNDPSDPDVTYATYWVEGVWSQSKYPQEAWAFLKFLSSRDSLEKLYQQASQADPRRRFGEPYPRADMRELLLNDPVVGGIISLAPTSQSWYLASRTFDGETGINSRLNSYLADAINTAVSSGSRSAGNAITTAAAGFQQVLVDYGLITPPPPVE